MAWAIAINVTTHEHGYAIVVSDYEDAKVIEDAYTNKYDLHANLSEDALSDLIDEYIETKDNKTLGTYEVQGVCLMVNDVHVFNNWIQYEDGKERLGMNMQQRLNLTTLIEAL